MTTQQLPYILVFVVILVGCGSGSSSDNSTSNPKNVSTVVLVNNAPIANAGEDQIIELGETATLSASASVDPDGDLLTYNWQINTHPKESTASLSYTDEETIEFTPDIFGVYVISLIVNDGKVDSEESRVTVTAIESVIPPTNIPPIANLGSDQKVTVGDYVTLSGANSFDAEGALLTYEWALTSIPSQSVTTLESTTSTQIEFNVDTSGKYEVSLIVNDGESSSAPAIVYIDASNTLVNITDKVFTNIATNCQSYVGSYYSNARDIKRAMNFDGDIVVNASTTHCTISSNTIPNHDFNDASASFANNVGEINADFSIPIHPTESATKTYLEIGTTEGVLLNGVTVDLLAAACYNVGNEPLGNEKIGCGPSENNHPWRYDPMSTLNTFGTDQHNAHTQPNGQYHYHGNPVAMFTLECEDKISSVIGFAADGYPIFGACIQDPISGEIRKANSSYQLKNNGGIRQDVIGYQTPQAGIGVIVSNNYDGQFRGDWQYVAELGDLDQCNGMTVDGQYGYYVTDSFPWILNCFNGETDSSFSSGPNNASRRMHSHDDVPVHTHR